MGKVGVELLVENLGKFTGDMGQVDKSIQSLIPGGNLLTGVFESIGKVFSNVADFAVNVLAHALGELLADAVQWLTQAFWDLVAAILDAANEFQNLQIRLDGLNLDQATIDTKGFTAAMNEAKTATAEQIDWMQTLAAATPFDPVDIENAYTLARAFGHTDEEARRLVTDITNYAAAMGLSSDKVVSIIENLGKMDARGKITMRTITNLTQSAFLPWKDILEGLSKELGVSTTEVQKMISTGEGVPADLFTKVFENLIETEPRFQGAAGRLGRTFVAASENIKQIFTSILGMQSVLPILNTLGEYIASIVDQFVAFDAAGNVIKTDKWDALKKAGEDIGKVLAEIIGEILKLGPTADGIAGGIVSAFQGVATWLQTHKEDIVGFFKAGYDFINDVLIPKMEEIKNFVFGTPATTATQQTPGLHGANAEPITIVTPGTEGLLSKVWGIIQDMQPLIVPIEDLFKAIFEVIGTLAGITFGDLSKKSFAENVALVAQKIEDFAKYISDNKEKIAEWIILIGRVITVLSVVSFVLNTIIGIVIWVSTVIAGLSIAWALLSSPIGVFILLIVLLGAVLFKFGQRAYAIWKNLEKQTEEMWKNIGRIIWNAVTETNAKVIAKYEELKTWISTKWQGIKDFITAKLIEIGLNIISSLIEWKTAFDTKVAEIKAAIIAKFQQIKDGVVSKLKEIKASIVQIWTDISDKVSNLGNWFDIGWNWMSDMADGVAAGASLLYNAMVDAVKAAYDAIVNFITGNTGGAAAGGSDSGATGPKSSTRSASIIRGVSSMSAGVSSSIQGVSSTAAPSQTNITNNYNLTINSSAAIEPLISDFAMMRSLS